jgi:hypothetical protein
MSVKTPSELSDLVRGDVIVEGDADYEDARSVHNGMIDKRPAVVVRVMNTGDVMATVNYARDNGLELSTRGGGHSGPGFGTNDGGASASIPRRRQPGLRAALPGATSTPPHMHMALPRPGASFPRPGLPVSRSAAGLGTCRADSDCR